MSRPSGVISTDQVLNREQMTSLREAWKNQSQGLNKGQIPILHAGMKFQPLAISSQDAQLIQAQRLSIEEIARVYGVPLPVIGDLSHATLNNVEQLISMWLSISLGALLENLERSLERLFEMGVNDRVNIDETALLRTDLEARINALTKAVQGGLYTPNEARKKEGLHAVDHGDKPYLQQQMVELGYTPEPVPQPQPKEEQPAVSVEEAKVIALHQIRKSMR